MRWPFEWRNALKFKYSLLYFSYFESPLGSSSCWLGCCDETKQIHQKSQTRGHISGAPEAPVSYDPSLTPHTLFLL